MNFNDFEYFLMALIAIGGPIVFAFGWAIRAEIAAQDELLLQARIRALRAQIDAHNAVEVALIEQKERDLYRPRFLRDKAASR